MNLSDFHRRGELRVVIRCADDPSAHRIAPHQPGIVGLQQFGRRAKAVSVAVASAESGELGSLIQAACAYRLFA